MTIRRATQKDAEAVAAHLFLAMEEILYLLIGERDAQKAKALMLHLAESENNQYSYQNCWVSEEDKEIVAAVNVYDGAKLTELREPVLQYLRIHFNRHLAPEDETGPGEYYIDSLGVHPAYRGKGTGTGLLQFLIEEYVQRQKQTAGLLVEEENTNAKRLYLKLGFQPVGSKVLLGKNLEHLQIKPGLSSCEAC